jgi:hypothetical protein
MTSLWIREVRAHAPIEIEWKFFSLAGVNERADVWHGPLRICALAGREGGQEAIDRAYLALGRLFHERDTSFDEIERLPELARPYLEEVGLEPSLATRALEDPTTLDEVLVQHTDAVERMKAFGVPWIVVDGDDMGFFGPVIGELPTGEEAVTLWEHFQWIGRQPYLYELKRGGRKKMQDLKGLSARFGERVPAQSASR